MKAILATRWCRTPFSLLYKKHWLKMVLNHVCAELNIFVLAYSRLSVSRDDRKSDRATSGVWERKREDALISPGSPSSPTRSFNLPHWPRSWNSLIFDEMEWWMKISFVFYLVKPQKPCLHGITSIVRVLWASIDYEQSKYFLCPSRLTWKKAREENCCAKSSSLILCSQFSSRSFFLCVACDGLG